MAPTETDDVMSLFSLSFITSQLFRGVDERMGAWGVSVEMEIYSATKETQYVFNLLFLC